MAAGGPGGALWALRAGVAGAEGGAEVLRYAATAVATLAAGPALDAFGWEALNAAMLPVVLAAGLMTWHWARGSARAATAAGPA
ncbi:hypothetical protein [Achromobacter ruhlandii]|uniref:hypothetical protein n=1 Tax=Achromobacter ruhlandii TaxID=72557 RepID=UPI003211AB10